MLAFLLTDHFAPADLNCVEVKTDFYDQVLNKHLEFNSVNNRISKQNYLWLQMSCSITPFERKITGRSDCCDRFALVELSFEILLPGFLRVIKSLGSSALHWDQS